MGMKHIVWAREHSRAQGGSYQVMQALAGAADENSNECFPSIATIARWARVDRATVFRALRELDDLKELEFKRRAGRATTYVLTLREPVANYDLSQPATRRTVRPHPSQPATEPVAQCDSTSRTVRPIKVFKDYEREKPIINMPLAVDVAPQPAQKAPPTPISDEAYKMLGNTFVAPEPPELSAGELWRTLKRECELQLPHGIYYHFCDDRIQVIGMEDDTLRIRVASDGAYKTLTGRIESVINRIATSIAGRPVQVCFEQEYQPLDVLLGVNR